MADLSDLAAAIEHKIAYSLHTAMLGKIVSYNPTKQTATVQPMTMGVYWTNTVVDDVPVAQKVYYRYQPLPNVPVIFPGGNGFSITWPLATGDTCVLQFTEDSLANALTSGDEGPQQSVARHQMSHALCIPVFVPQPKPSTDQTTTGNNSMMLGQSGGAQIIIDPNNGIIVDSAVGVQLGSGASQLVALSNLTDTMFSDLISAVHTALNSIGPTTGGAAAATTFQSTMAAQTKSTAADITKAK